MTRTSLAETPKDKDGVSVALTGFLRHVAKLKLELNQLGEALEAAERAGKRGAFAPSDLSFDPIFIRRTHELR